MSSRNNVSLRVDVQMALTCILLVLCFLQFCAGQDLQTQFLSPHNDARSQVGVGPLVWDNTVAAYAQNYANQRMADCALQHSGGQYGENIFLGSGAEFTPADAVNTWVTEKQYYSYDSNTCTGGQQCGHYTQVVWENSQKLGCARVKCNSGAIFITCNYDPPGNYVGQRPYGSTSTSVEPPRSQFLSPHNEARSEVGVGPLVWDDTVAAYAQNYANQRMADCALQHSGGQYGENLFWGSGAEFTPADAVNSWVNEKQYYNYDSNTCAQGQQCGHYTQVVWKNTQKLGCARVKCDSHAIFITCNYDPPGNYVGQRPYGPTSTSVELRSTSVVLFLIINV